MNGIGFRREGSGGFAGRCLGYDGFARGLEVAKGRMNYPNDIQTVFPEHDL